jgi:DNA-binding XRE family transcriptional regulator
MMKYTEIYFDDALRLAQFLSERTGKEIVPVEMDSEGFPMPPQNEEFGERTQALIVGDNAIAFFRKRTGIDANRKKRDRNLHRIKFGIKLKTARERANMTLEDLADFTDYNPKTLERVENGRFDASLDMMCNLAAALGCDIGFVDYKE